MHLLRKYLHVQSYGKAFQNWQIMLLEHVVEKPDYRLITADCVSTCATLVCHTVNWLYETDPQTPEHVLQFCPPVWESTNTALAQRTFAEKFWGSKADLLQPTRCINTTKLDVWGLSLNTKDTVEKLTVGFP